MLIQKGQQKIEIYVKMLWEKDFILVTLKNLLTPSSKYWPKPGKHQHTNHKILIKSPHPWNKIPAVNSLPPDLSTWNIKSWNMDNWPSHDVYHADKAIRISMASTAMAWPKFPSFSSK